tara:strand:- start:2310 stop:2951 length:642 start_codon:yes stop_codon:yes gene_type:complete
MRQHVNPLSKYFQEIESIPQIDQIFKYPNLPTHLDIGCASGKFLFQLAEHNKNWNYLGIEIREKLINNAKCKLNKEEIDNLYFIFGNADNLLKNWIHKYPDQSFNSVSINFPDPWFKKKHHKRRIIQAEFLNKLALLMTTDSLLFIKSDVEDLFKYMDSAISNTLIFEKVNNKNKNPKGIYNPSRIKTEREKYAISKNFTIHESTYKKISIIV